MKGLMKKASALAAACVLSVSAFAVGADAFGGVTEIATPDEKTDTVLKWAAQISQGWSNSPSMPCISGDEIVYVASNKLQALDRRTGEKLGKSAELGAKFNSYGIIPPLAADGKIFVAMGGGTVQAFDAETFESLWIYRDELGGQALSEMVYDDGYLYTGFWNSETKDANFVCIPTEDTAADDALEEQQAAWKYTTAGGYYWSGAYVTDDLVIFGTDNGQSDGASKGSKLVAMKKNESIESGEAVVSSEVGDLFGDLRSAVTYDAESGYYFVTSKSNLLIRFNVTDGEIRNVHSLVLPGASTSTPVAANGRVYLGVSGGGFKEYSGHQIVVIDSEKLEVVYGVQTNGYCQSSALVSSRGGENYVYFTANYTPGKVYVLHDNAGMTAPEKTETVTLSDGGTLEACPTLFTPVGSHAQYCLGSVMTDEDGTLFFKNDSGAIFALSSRLDKVKVDGKKLYKEGETIDPAAYSVTAVYADGSECDISGIAECTYEEGALKAGKGEISFGYDGMEYGDTETETGHEYGAVYGDLEYTVLGEADYDALFETIAAIDSIGAVTLDSKSAIDKARAAYDSLSADAKEFVDNYAKLTQAEKDFEKIYKDAQKVGDLKFKSGFSSTANAVRVNWQRVDGADGYRVYFLNKKTRKYEKLGEVGADVTTYRKGGLAAGVGYKFKVCAYKNVLGKTFCGKYTVKLAVTKPSATSVVSKKCVRGRKAVKVAYKKVSGANGYEVQYYNAAKKKWVKAATVKSGAKTLAYVSGLKPATSYKFRVRAYKTVDSRKLYSAWSKTVKLTTKK